ncbi:aspartate aminotransferase family protein [Prochlorococcus sp. MIT 1341]|uniref:aspartate aminotransferase family protein n=1 Tax=Prochlorococcus sp. MIT 1341 TaxID=3096221 RepID=UPI002A756779|nr:aspartate aminotransferase family protein [Prochlorococcus sp. MIT 1341]
MGSSPTAPTALMETYNRLPIAFTRGKGCWLWDSNGNCFLDAVAGIATCSLGHSDRALRRELSKQLNRLQHVSNLFRIPEQEELAKWLVKNSCAQKVFFCNSGAEANEASIKLSRKYGHLIRNIENPIILSAKSSFHGRTLAALSATGQTKYHEGFGPLVKGFEFFSFNDIQSIERLLYRLEAEGPKVASVLIEPIQGEGGVNPGTKIFFKRLRELCDEYKVLLIFDEVQIGMARSGHWWGYQELGVEPDAFTIAKGLGGGHAIGALLVKEKADLFSPGDHASTFGGNPFACKAGLTVAKEIEKRKLLSNVQARGKQITSGLVQLINEFPHELKEVRGWGLLQGLVIQEDSTLIAEQLVKAAIKERLLIGSAGRKVVRIIPPLTITSNEVKKILIRLKSSLIATSK